MLRFRSIFCLATLIFCCYGGVVFSYQKVYGDKHHFSIVFPAEWSIEKNSRGFDILALRPAAINPFPPNATVKVIPVSRSMTLDTFVKNQILILKKHFPDFKEFKESDSSLSGKPARWLGFQTSASTTKIWSVAYYVLDNQLVYVITCSATMDQFPGWRTMFGQIIHSFQLEK